jgi:FAD/FMN-containing dehydrogenase
MADLEVTNWFGDLVSHPRVIVDANSVDDIVAVMKDATKYPSPVRAAGSNHSTAPCADADGGTLLRMKMNRILKIDADTITVEAGARHIDMARELEKRNLQFYVNTEIGSARPAPAPKTHHSPANMAKSDPTSSRSSSCCQTATCLKSPTPSPI